MHLKNVFYKCRILCGFCTVACVWWRKSLKFQITFTKQVNFNKVHTCRQFVPPFINLKLGIIFALILIEPLFHVNVHFSISSESAVSPRKHRPLQPRHQSQAIISASSRPGAKRGSSEAAAADHSAGPSGNLGVALFALVIFLSPKGRRPLLFGSCWRHFPFGRRVHLLAVVWSATVGIQFFYFMSLQSW